MTFALPNPYLPGLPGAGLGDNPDEFAERVQQNMDAVALTLGSTQAQPVVQSYTPAWTGSTTNPVIGNGTLVGRYTRVNKLVWFTVHIIAGSTTTFGSGTYNVTLPVTMSTNHFGLVNAAILDAGVQVYVGHGVLRGDSNTTAFADIAIGSGSVGSWQATSPFTFGNTDRAYLTGWYEAA